MPRLLCLTLLCALLMLAHAASEPPEAAAMRVLDAFMTGFNARDLEAWEATYHFPHFRFAGGELTVLDAAGERSPAVFEALATGWHHSAWLSRKSQASEEKVHVVVEFARYRADGLSWRAIGRSTCCPTRMAVGASTAVRVSHREPPGNAGPDGHRGDADPAHPARTPTTRRGSASVRRICPRCC